MYLEDTHTAFYEEPGAIQLSACAYLHNYSTYPEDPLFASKFHEIVQSTPLFTADDVPQFERYLTSRLDGGEGLVILGRVEESEFRPSKKLMDHVAGIIKGKSEYILLDEQIVVYDRVLACAREGFHDRKKTVVIVKGGPGTGKSVIAINLMADLLRQGYNAQYATGSRAFTETLRKAIGIRGAVQFKYFNSYTSTSYNSVDVLIADEAHRIRKTSSNRFTAAERRTDAAQIDELLGASKVAVFFIDDDQVVRPDEIGSVEYIRERSDREGARVLEYELETQFRCAGSSAFVNWVNHTLEIRETANATWSRDELFDFRLAESPEVLERMILEKAAAGFSARMTAGFCWPWS
ncbi:MAG TPA: DNA/RNA helicase domain-containing protein, partial [Thermoplasmata archaeon]|nr:DNA/RNA helicase domain-containing protein [Thermoplasmata archaeon]